MTGTKKTELTAEHLRNKIMAGEWYLTVMPAGNGRWSMKLVSAAEKDRADEIVRDYNTQLRKAPSDTNEDIAALNLQEQGGHIIVPGLNNIDSLLKFTGRLNEIIVHPSFDKEKRHKLLERLQKADNRINATIPLNEIQLRGERNHPRIGGGEQPTNSLGR